MDAFRPLGRLLALLPLLALAPAASASTYLVLPDGSGDFPNIKAAVDSVADGDEILLGDGTFDGDENLGVDFLGKAITIRSASGNAAACIVRGDTGAGFGQAGFLFRSGEGAGSILRDLTIQDTGFGYVPNDLGAIRCDGSSPTVRNVIVDWNLRGIVILGGGTPDLDHVQVRYSGAPAVSVSGASPTLTGCLIESNTSSGTGGGWTGGILLHTSDAVLDGCVVQNNRGLHDGGVRLYGSSPTLRDCVIVNNTGEDAGGLTVLASTPTLLRCTVSRNAGDLGGGLSIGDGSVVALQQSVVWGNCGNSADEIEIAPGALLNAACSDVRLAGVGGGGSLVPVDVIDFAPLFCDPKPCGVHLPWTAGSYTVDQDSEVMQAPCGPMGALAADCDIGIEPVTWGRLKALYR